MGLEVATFIHQLDANNPLSSDSKGQGDDHIRLIKSALQATFPNVDGLVTASHTELNVLFQGNSYSPIFSNLSNLNSASQAMNFFWLRIGDIVFVLGKALLVPTVDANPSSVQLTIPVARPGGNFVNVTSAGGMATGGRANSLNTTQAGAVTSVNASQRIQIAWGVGPGNNHDILFAYILT
jgi:hypothetical protein